MKPDFIFCNSFALSWTDKVTTGVTDQVRMRLISQLIKGNYLILRVLQKLLKHFNCTAISTSFVLPAGTVAAIFILDLNDSEFTIAASCSSSLQCSHKHSDTFK